MQFGVWQYRASGHELLIEENVTVSHSTGSGKRILSAAPKQGPPAFENRTSREWVCTAASVCAPSCASAIMPPDCFAMRSSSLRTGSRNMQVWTLRNPARYVFVAAEDHGDVRVRRMRSSRPGPRRSRRSGRRRAGSSSRRGRGLRSVPSLGRGDRRSRDTHGGGNRRLAVDRVNPEGFADMTALGVTFTTARRSWKGRGRSSPRMRSTACVPRSPFARRARASARRSAAWRNGKQVAGHPERSQH